MWWGGMRWSVTMSVRMADCLTRISLVSYRPVKKPNSSTSLRSIFSSLKRKLPSWESVRFRGFLSRMILSRLTLRTMLEFDDNDSVMICLYGLPTVDLVNNPDDSVWAFCFTNLFQVVFSSSYIIRLAKFQCITTYGFFLILLILCCVSVLQFNSFPWEGIFLH